MRTLNRTSAAARIVSTPGVVLASSFNSVSRLERGSLTWSRRTAGEVVVEVLMAALSPGQCRSAMLRTLSANPIPRG
jgi:hypothetical protein